jgi:hypothetical protein
MTTMLSLHPTEGTIRLLCVGVGWLACLVWTAWRKMERLKAAGITTDTIGAHRRRVARAIEKRDRRRLRVAR